jgi:hypothetical protein
MSYIEYYPYVHYHHYQVERPPSSYTVPFDIQTKIKELEARVRELEKQREPNGNT